MTAENPATSETPPKQSTFGALKVFAERRSLVMLALGFSAGLPNLLIFDTLSAWLRQAGLSLEVIGFFGLATLAYSFKFLWAPLIDRSKVPVLTAMLGHRRSWMLVSQAVVMVGLWLVAGSNPVGNLGLVALFAVIVGFASANQDIVIDAWRIEAADDNRQGVMAAAYQWGYRIAAITAGGPALILAQFYGWSASYSIMAALMLIGAAAVLLAPREQAHVVRPIHADDVPSRPVLEVAEWLARLAVLAFGGLIVGSGLTGNADLLAGLLTKAGFGDFAGSLAEAWKAKPNGVWLQVTGVVVGFVIIALATQRLPGVATRPGVYMSKALSDPLKDFFGRYGKVAGLILATICLYRVADFVLNIMNPFYEDLGFSLTEIGVVRKGIGIWMTMIGVGFAGWTIARLGLLRSLVIGALAQPISNLVFIWLAVQGKDIGALTIAIGFDNIASGFAGTCLIAYMSSLTAEGFTATQYALFSSLYSLPGKLLASQSGRIVEGAAASADTGGVAGLLKGLFINTPPEAYVHAIEKSKVSPAALGAGYATFFLYSALIGMVAVVLTVMVARRQTAATNETPA